MCGVTAYLCLLTAPKTEELAQESCIELSGSEGHLWLSTPGNPPERGCFIPALPFVPCDRGQVTSHLQASVC